MAVTHLSLVDSQTWIYPPQTYTGYDGIYKKKNHWYNGHSVLDRRGKRMYQAGNSASDGNYNGNMMSFFFFKGNGLNLKQFVQSIGGSKKITKIILRVTCGHSWYSSMNMRVCMGPYWNTTNKWGQGGFTEATADSYDGLGIKHLTTISIAKGSRKEIDLTQWKSYFDTYETLAMYVPGAYNKDYNAYGWIYGHLNSGSNIPQLEIHYNTNSAPNPPGIAIHNATDSHGYMTPNLTFSIINNGDPDNNISSTPYAYQLYDQNGNLFSNQGWFSSEYHQVSLEGHRGRTVRLRARIRDYEGLEAYNDKYLYVNQQPYWTNGSANAVMMWFESGVTNSVFKDNITIRWPAAYDPHSAHNNNLRYSIYCQKGTDVGPGGDNAEALVAWGLTGTSYTLNAASMKIPVAKGERIYFSVWVSDGLEWSTYRLTSSWIYREKPPTSPTNVSPTGGHYESSVDVSWSASSGSNGTTVSYYKVVLLNKYNEHAWTYHSNTPYMTCTHLSQIARGDTFRFMVTAIDNLGNESTAAYSGTCKRNSAPTNPKNFRVNSNKTHFKGTIPLIWTASIDADSDPIKYNVYFNVNNGSYQSLVLGTSSTSCTHDISSFPAGIKFNYYVEAYDKFNIYSEKVYIEVRPEVNTPPNAPSILYPLTNREIYSRFPRITFQVGALNNTENVEAIIAINGKEYKSKIHTSLFSASSFGANEKGMFVVPDNAPLNYSKQNEIKIKLYDGMDYSIEKSINIPVVASTYLKIPSNEDRYINNDLKNIRKMINANRFAYGQSETVWKEDHVLKKAFYDELGDSIHALTIAINNMTKSTNLKRTYSKNIISKGDIIDKKYINNILDMIEKS